MKIGIDKKCSFTENIRPNSISTYMDHFTFQKHPCGSGKNGCDRSRQLQIAWRVNNRMRSPWRLNLVHRVTTAAQRRWRLPCPNLAPKWSVFAQAVPGSQVFATFIQPNSSLLSIYFKLKAPFLKGVGGATFKWMK